MKDIMGMMGKVKELQSRMENMQAELEDLTADGEAGGGMVRVTLNGKGVMKTIHIDPSLLNPDEAEIVEDLLIAAHNKAKESIEELTKNKTAELTAGLPLPPGMKLPF